MAELLVLQHLLLATSSLPYMCSGSLPQCRNPQVPSLTIMPHQFANPFISTLKIILGPVLHFFSTEMSISRILKKLLD